MILQLFTKKKDLTFERRYAASVEDVWDAWTRPEILRQWWGPQKTSIVECEVELRVGGRIHIVMEAGEAMGKYAGTRWPMSGTFTLVDDRASLSYDARSWTDGEEATTTIEHANELTLTADGDETVVHLRVAIKAIGPGAKMAAFGMRWGYKAQFDKLDAYLTA